MNIKDADCTMLGGLEMFRDEIIKCDHLVIVGCGSSFYAGLFALKYFKILECFETVIKSSFNN